jgi:hypothetical protein
MPDQRANIVAIVLSAGCVLGAVWYAVAPVNADRYAPEVNSPTGPSVDTEQADSNTRRPLDRSVFDVVLWHESPPPPAPEPERPTAVVQAAPPPQVDLLAITSTPDGFEAVFYDKGSDRLHTVKGNDPLGSYRVGAIGPTWVRLDFNGRETTLQLDQPRIAARESEAADE